MKRSNRDRKERARAGVVQDLKDGLSYIEIGKKYRLSPSIIYLIIKETGFSIRDYRARFPTPYQLELVKVFVENGEDAKETARRLGISTGNLYEQIRNYHAKMAALEESEEFEDVDLYA